MHQLLNSVCYATWHRTHAWEKRSKQETFCKWDLFQLMWQSSGISRAVRSQGSATGCSCAEIARDPCDWPVGQTPPVLLTEGQAPHLMQHMARSFFLWRQCNSLVVTSSSSALTTGNTAALHRNTCSLPPCLLLHFPTNITLETSSSQGHIFYVQKKS